MSANVEPIVQEYIRFGEQFAKRKLSWETDDLVLQNIQARVRSPGAWMIANMTADSGERDLLSYYTYRFRKFILLDVAYITGNIYPGGTSVTTGSNDHFTEKYARNIFSPGTD